MKIISVIGARPQIIKAAAISRTIKNKYNSKILSAFNHFSLHPPKDFPAIFGEGKATDFIVEKIIENINC